jgi:hypothetical protein
MRWLAIPLLLVAGALHAADDENAKLWAVILDPATPQAARMEAVDKMDGHGTPQNIEKAMQAQLEVAREAARDPKPWHADVLRALDRLYMPAGYIPGIDFLRKMPCTSELEEQLMYRNLERFLMRPELYGVLRNLARRHDGRLTTKREWFGWGQYRGEDKDIWPASQAFVVEFAADADRDMLKRLVRIVDRMRHADRDNPEPYTALLAVLNRIDAVAEEPKQRCWVAGQASFLLHGYDLPRIPANAPAFVNEMREYPIWNPDTYENAAECDAWIGTFRTWFAAHRQALEIGAAAEREAIAKARARMLAEELCR